MQYYAVSWSPDGEYIAFAEGGIDGAEYDFGRTYDGTAELFIYQRRTGKVQHVVSSRTLRGPWTWRGAHTLLYGSMTPQDEKIFLNQYRTTGVEFKNGKPIMWEKIPGHPKRTSTAPNVYEYLPDTRQTKLLQRDAFVPVASPNGKRLAFIGSQDTSHPFPMPRDFFDAVNDKFVIVTDASTPSQRIALSQHNGLYPDLLWRDNAHLLVMQRTAPPPDARYEIREWDVTQKKSRIITTLEEHDPCKDRSDNDPIFRPLRLSTDGQALFMDVYEYGGDSGCEINSTNDVLERIDLTSGAITIIGRVKDTTGIDWHDTITSRAAQTKTP